MDDDEPAFDQEEFMEGISRGTASGDQFRAALRDDALLQQDLLVFGEKAFWLARDMTKVADRGHAFGILSGILLGAVDIAYGYGEFGDE